MNRDEIESAVALRGGADTNHETARDWYDSYGWHLTTEECGDVCVQAVQYDWIDDEDNNKQVTARLLRDHHGMTRDEAESLVTRARQVRVDAETICDLLDDAVAAYLRGDLHNTRQDLLAAYSVESEHGDAPATLALADKLLADCGGNHFPKEIDSADAMIDHFVSRAVESVARRAKDRG